MSRKQDQNGADNVVTCLECDRKLHLGYRAAVGDFVTCPSCDSEFEVVSLKPARIEWAYDYDDEYDEIDAYYEEEAY